MIRTHKIKRYQYHPGFALPTILIASVVMLAVLMVSITSTAAVRTSLLGQYYDQLTQAAANSGVVYAKSCLEISNNIPLWSDSKPLKPHTDCSGNEISDGLTCTDTSNDSRCSVAINDTVISSFSVKLPKLDSNGMAVNIASDGTTNVLRKSDSVVSRQYKKTAFSITHGIEITSIGSISGIARQHEILTMGSVLPIEATYNIQWQISDDGINYNPISNATGLTYYTQTADLNKYIRVAITGNGEYIGSLTSTATSPIAFYEYYHGKGVLTGKLVYYQDVGDGTRYSWGPQVSGCPAPQCQNSLDPSVPGQPALVASNSVDFSAYPARNACKNLVPGGTGRLPYLAELAELKSDTSYYGGNFRYPYYYNWGAAQANVNMGGGVYATDMYSLSPTGGTRKDMTNTVRCVFD